MKRRPVLAVHGCLPPPQFAVEAAVADGLDHVSCRVKKKKA
jgi:hypothetical protein